ncbi:uncharacterized protein LOC101856677 [Aplysia californica]|uniref:Uncharacterized protein LOC101856677 n=1 Tax=Aplysia californica TaxID=6500 RepID=A0ABM0JZA5_APLCA|nr:uncharacterized protein LOC101856677 [Aplysia californica]
MSVFTFQQPLPVDAMSHTYVSFPPPGDFSDIYLAIAIYGDTTIEVPDQLANGDPAIENSYLRVPGDAVSFSLKHEGYHVITSTKPISLRKTSKSLDHPTINWCSFSLIPKAFWSPRYSWNLPADLYSDTQTVTLYVVIDTGSRHLLRKDGTPLNSLTWTPVLIGSATALDLSGSSQVLADFGNHVIDTDLSGVRFTAYLFLSGSGNFACQFLVQEDEWSASLSEHSPPHSCNWLGLETASLIKQGFDDAPEPTNSSSTPAGYATATTEQNTILNTENNDNAVTATAAAAAAAADAGADAPVTELNITEDLTQALIRAIHEDLIVNPKSTSTSIRKKISIPDYRTSSIGIGTLGIVFCSMVLVAVMVADAVRFFSWFHNSVRH